MRSLYTINEDILNLADPETGEIADFSALEKLVMERDAKIENMALWYKNLVAEAEMVKAEKNAFAERQRACEEKAERIKAYLEDALAGTKFSSPKVVCSFRKTTSVHITDQDKLPADCLRIKTEPDKAAIKNAILWGKEVEGAELVTSLSLSIK